MRADMVVDKQAVLAVLEDPGVVLINALGRRQHRGEVNEYGRRGHIPGSRNVTAWEIPDRATQRYRPLPELRGKVGTALQAERVITYCGAVAAASSLAHVLVRLGHPHVAVYDGGLLEWCADPRLPLKLAHSEVVCNKRTRPQRDDRPTRNGNRTCVIPPHSTAAKRVSWAGRA
jgi:thiosulfate/3-mercaptopyruvate sulfurtransferase